MLAAAAISIGRQVRAEEQPPAEASPPGKRHDRNEVGATPDIVRLLAVGDLMLGTPRRSAAIRARGALAPFAASRPMLRAADLAFGNLETPISERGSPTPGKTPESIRAGKNFLFRAPPQTARGVAWAGFDVVSLANNHAMDYGAPALSDTLALLKQQDVLPVGAGASLAEAAAPVFIERKGQRFAIFAVSDIVPAFSAAGKSTPGIASVRGRWFRAQMPQAIAQAREQADWVLVSVHWGVERNTGSTLEQRSLGRQLIDWGAHVVIGHHTHVLGPVEHYRGGLIHYSLGNFVGLAGRKTPVGVWELRFRRGAIPTERSHLLRWNGAPLPVPSRKKRTPLRRQPEESRKNRRAVSSSTRAAAAT
jgi:poly-gamma-glutamate synthesis protein (capsule biosynthesis protein)